MPKTQFYDGSYVTSSWVETVYGSGPAAGHDHKGLDQDGSSQKIDLTNMVTGILPSTNIATIPWLNISGNNTMSDISAGLTAIISNGYVSITTARAVKFNLNIHLELQLAISSITDPTSVKITIIGMTPSWLPADRYITGQGQLFVWTQVASYQQLFAGTVIPMWASWTGSKNIYIQHRSSDPLMLNGQAASISCIMDYEAANA